MRVAAAILTAIAAGPAVAFDALSRFDAGVEGWSLEGPGTLEWVQTPGTGGHLKVTRTGQGEVYLVAPAAFNGDWHNVMPRIALNYRLGQPVASRGIRVEISGPGGQVETGSDQLELSASQWTAISGWMSSQQNAVLSNVTQVRFRMGTDPSLPVGEVIFVDSIGVQSCPANCDGSTGTPVLTANDFMCFMIGIANRDPRCNFDGRNRLAFGEEMQAFLNHFAVGCQAS